MKEQLHAIMSKATGNCIAILCNVEDAILLQSIYERKSGPDTYEIADATKQHAAELLNRSWVSQDHEILEMIFQKREER